MQKIKFLNTGNRTNIVKAVLVLGVIFLFGFTRIWKLATLPLGIHIDEAGMAYDAWCLSQYGVDRYLKPWPVYLTNFGSGQSSLYAFLCAFLFKLFGYSIWMMRVPAVLFSLLNLVFGIKIVQKIYPHKVFLPIAAGGLLTICPYFIMAGRLGLDCNLMLGMSTVFLYFIITAIESRENGRYILAGVTGGILLYTYALTYVIVPVFLLLLFLYVIRTQKFYFRGWAAMAIPFGVIAVPLILVQIVNLFDLEEFRLAGLTITKLQTYRVSELGHFQLHNLRRVLESILWGDSLNYNSIPQFANLFWITNLFFLFGLAVAVGQLWNSVRKRRLEMSAIVLFWFISTVVLGSHVEVNVNKMNGVFYAVVFLAVIGMDACIRAGGKIIAHIRVSEERKRWLTNTAVCMFTGGYWCTQICFLIFIFLSQRLWSLSRKIIFYIPGKRRWRNRKSYMQ